MSQANTPIANTPVVSDSDVCDGKLFATLSYVVPFFLLLPLVKRENGYALYHAKQALTLWIAAVVVSIVLTVIGFVLPGMLAGLVSLVFSLACLGLMILGAWTAWSERRQALPIIGAVGEKYLAGIR